jgi:hypothetical protein
MAAWAKDMGTEAKGIHMLADPRCEFSQAIGCTQDDTAKLGNFRSRRYSMARALPMHAGRPLARHCAGITLRCWWLLKRFG